MFGKKDGKVRRYWPEKGWNNEIQSPVLIVKDGKTRSIETALKGQGIRSHHISAAHDTVSIEYICCNPVSLFIISQHQARPGS